MLFYTEVRRNTRPISNKRARKARILVGAYFQRKLVFGGGGGGAVLKEGIFRFLNVLGLTIKGYEIQLKTVRGLMVEMALYPG